MMTTNHLTYKRKASSLVTTLLVLVVLSTIVVAFMQSMAVERLTAKSAKNAYVAQLAAEAGLNSVLDRLSVLTNYHYSIGNSVVVSSNYGISLLVKQQGTTNLTLTNPLFSKSSTTNIATFKLPDSNKVYSYYVNLTNSTGETNARYAFWVEDENSKQNLALFGATSRINLTNFSEIPLIQSNGSAWPSNGYAASLKNAITQLTVQTANQVLPTAGFSSATPVSEFYYTMNSPSVQLTPEGEPKLNLIKLKGYIDGTNGSPALSLLQGPSSPRAQLVSRLLNEDGSYPASNTNTPWGGGSLSFLTNAYPITQARQIVANIIDYIDEDLIPTTDGQPGTGPSGSDLTSGQKNGNESSMILTAQTAPAFIGVEARSTSSGSKIFVIGHPYITYIGTGLQINSGTNAINSTRIYGWMQIVNPWEGTNTWRMGTSDGYFLDMQVKLDGSVSGGSRGTTPQAPGASGYFLLNSLGQISGYDGQHSGRSITPRGKVMFPREWHNSGYDLANGWYTINSGNITIANFQQRIEIARLIYKVNGQRYLIEDLGILNSIPRTYNPSTATFGGSSSTIKHPYTQADWHYVGDPRFAYQSTNWVLTNTSGSDMGPVSATSGNQVYSKPVNPNKDAQQNLTDNQLWWSNASVTNHFPTYTQGYRPSMPAGEIPMLSYSEFGFISAGKPWQTLHLYADTNAISANALAADLRIADYVDLGITTNRRTNTFGQVMINGQINVNTRKIPTLISLLSGATNLSSPGLIATNTLAAATTPMLRPTDIFVLTNASGKAVITNSSTTDFGREKLYGQLAPALTASATRFTVYSLGETLQKGKVISTVLLEATVELVPVTIGTSTTLKPVIRFLKQL